MLLTKLGKMLPKKNKMFPGDEIVIDCISGIGNPDEKHLTQQYVDITPLKKFLEKAKPESPLTESLRKEPDLVPVSLFLARFPLYLQLADLEKKKKPK
jgi:hypothetical protein